MNTIKLEGEIKMELAIAIFIGVWFSLSGIISTIFVYKDYKLKKKGNTNE